MIFLGDIRVKTTVVLLEVAAGRVAGIVFGDVGHVGQAAAYAKAVADFAFALSPTSADCALLVSLPPGNYTAQLTGNGSTSGVGLLEIYEVQ